MELTKKTSLAGNYPIIDDFKIIRREVNKPFTSELS